ncbi:MAG TPA: rhomboid family intramembrane serine protease [Dongiaceae bacterium]|nr:rhomboid family intramembrane serine protease [Dongiaceae bacterium]
MLIIPADRGIDWRRAPVATGALILLCCLIFFAWQWNDDDKLEAAATFYMQEDLLKLEYPVFVSYLSQSGRKDAANKIEALWKADDKQMVALHILSDHGFTRDLDDTDIEFWGEDVYYHWHGKRKQLNEMLSRISAFHLGLVPAEHRPITFLTYQFLHGDTFHLIGNMVVLAIVAAGVEAAIGSFNFLMCYLFCGLFAGIFFAVINLGSYVPLVGASGSISGVLGMYAALYGMRKIRFFYSAIFYFGYFTAPALVVLPIWILWEIINAIWGNTSGIAYWAHAGGLLAGGAGMTLGRKYLLQVEETYLDTSPDEDEQYRKALDDFLKQLGAFNFDVARRKLAELEAQYPDKPVVMEHRYYLEKLRPKSEEFHQCALNLLGRNATDPWLIHILHDVFRDYIQHDGLSRISDELLLKLMLSFSQIEAWDTLREAMKEVSRRQLRHPMLVKVLRVLAKGVSSKGERDLAERYQSMASSMEKDLKDPQLSR